MRYSFTFPVFAYSAFVVLRANCFGAARFFNNFEPAFGTEFQGRCLEQFDFLLIHIVTISDSDFSASTSWDFFVCKPLPARTRPTSTASRGSSDTPLVRAPLARQRAVQTASGIGRLTVSFRFPGLAPHNEHLLFGERGLRNEPPPRGFWVLGFHAVWNSNGLRTLRASITLLNVSKAFVSFIYEQEFVNDG
jgi:hypothetical protein